MSRKRGGWTGAAVVAAALALIACPAQQGGPPPAEPAGADPSPAWASGGPAASPAVALAPVEAGFTNCCGTERYRIEIECGEMLKRCYENQGGTWRQTYGRHCKENLGEACYLEDCDAKCQ
ncbi:MAG TPA: hypothetical protein VK698_28870 [Kofleriaceae bacterium]|nr:hypothetical protein [Kofleriaceae bacterium]